MRSRIENLWKSAAGDGALTPVGVARPESDFDDLMDAWSRERQTSIECRLAMEEAGRLLREILDEARLPAHLRRRVKGLVQVIETCGEAEHGCISDEK